MDKEEHGGVVGQAWREDPIGTARSHQRTFSAHEVRLIADEGIICDRVKYHMSRRDALTVWHASIEDAGETPDAILHFRSFHRRRWRLPGEEFIDGMENAESHRGNDGCDYGRPYLVVRGTRPARAYVCINLL